MQDTVARSAGSPSSRASTPHYHRGGTVTLARTPVQLERLRAGVATAHVARLHRGRRAAARAGRGARDARRRARPRRLLHPALRGDPPRAAGARAGPGGRGGRGARSSSGPACSAIEPGSGRDRRRHGAGRGRAARDRGLHRRGSPASRRAVAPVYSLMVATEPLDEATWDSIGLAGPPDLLRRPPPDHLRPAHGRRPAGLRRSRCAVPLRLAHPVRRTTWSRGSSTTSAPVLRELLPQLGSERTARSSPTSGAAASASPATGPPRSGSTAAPGSAGPAGTSATAWPPPTSPAAPWPTWSPGADSDLVTLPWVNHRSRRWEPEPLRWLGHQRRAAGDDAGRRRGGAHRSREPDRAPDGAAHRRSLRPPPAVRRSHRPPTVCAYRAAPDLPEEVRGQRDQGRARRRRRTASAPARPTTPRMLIDPVSKAIIEQLQQDGRRSYAGIAAAARAHRGGRPPAGHPARRRRRDADRRRHRPAPARVRPPGHGRRDRRGRASRPSAEASPRSRRSTTS